tara:strand:+ start:291 stop:512 length:222 start_codon:yes stop_codon:yes gene_type:complete
MPTAAQLRSTKKKLRKTTKKSMKNAPKVPNANTYRVIKTDPGVQRVKEAKKLIAEMELRKKQYMDALKKLKAV